MVVGYHYFWKRPYTSLEIYLKPRVHSPNGFFLLDLGRLVLWDSREKHPNPEIGEFNRNPNHQTTQTANLTISRFTKKKKHTWGETLKHLPKNLFRVPRSNRGKDFWAGPGQPEKEHKQSKRNEKHSETHLKNNALVSGIKIDRVCINVYYPLYIYSIHNIRNSIQF